MKQVAIAGCGPAGLAAAIALHDAGFQITLFERFEQPGPVGSGLMLQPTGLAVLEQFGLRNQVEHLGQRIDGLTGRIAPAGKRVLDINYRVLRRGMYGVAIHRASLFHVLYNAVLKRDIKIETNKTIADLAYSNCSGVRTSGVYLVTANREQIEQQFDLVVDASGSQSQLLSHALRQTRRKPLDYGALWATVDLGNTGFSRNLLEQRYKAASIMVGVLPCGRLPDSQNEIATLFWSVKSSSYQAVLDAGMDAWKQQVTRQWPAVAQLTEQLADFNDLTLARYSHHTLSRPYGQNIVFIGDAAHATSPQLGQGVNMALLDAAALAASMSCHPFNRSNADGLQQSFRLYARARRTHVRLFQAASLMLTPFYQSDSIFMPYLRGLLFEPVGRLAYANRLVTSLGAGMLAKPLETIAKTVKDS